MKYQSLRHGLQSFLTGMVFLFFCLRVGYAAEAVSSMESVAAPTKARISLAVVPLCMANAGDVVNNLSLEVAKSLSVALRGTGALQLLSDAQIAEALNKANISRNMSGKKFDDIKNVLPPVDIIITVGPLLNNGWFPWLVFKTKDLTGIMGQTLFESAKEGGIIYTRTDLNKPAPFRFTNKLSLSGLTIDKMTGWEATPSTEKSKFKEEILVKASEAVTVHHVKDIVNEIITESFAGAMLIEDGQNHH